ncbi:MAG: ribonuclease P protein component [Bacteroidales bacterium]|nr:ribonuclease P protein component [Bacteroidales bacterium]
MEKQSKNTFPKNERITSRDKIFQLFQNGKPVKSFPVYAKYILVENQELYSQILISVSKKKIKKAVDRNRIKRLIREAYRLNKYILISELQDKNIKLAIVINYSLSVLTDFNVINKSIVKLFARIIEGLNE